MGRSFPQLVGPERPLFRAPHSCEHALGRDLASVSLPVGQGVCSGQMAVTCWGLRSLLRVLASQADAVRRGGTQHWPSSSSVLCPWLVLRQFSPHHPTRQIFFSLPHRRMGFREAGGFAQGHTGREPQAWGLDMHPSESSIQALPAVCSHTVTQDFFR